ncbi:MAG: CDC48 family AAA ATPase [Armatimonadetes bacterium]|nr:CDC48 family AAA ATPase [Armatimonadota bacterium]
MTKEALETIALKVAEGKARDVGRGIARIDPDDMEKLKLVVGDIIKIIGKKETAAKLMPAYMEDRGKSIIQIDGLIRENAGVSLDENVKITKTKHMSANLILLAPLNPLTSTKEKDTQYIGRLLEGLPVTEGDRLRATLFGSRSQDFTCLETKPAGIVLVNSQTIIKIKREESLERKGEKISYEDIGGLGKEIRRIREMVELPLKFPQVFQRLGIEAPKGVLLHGPPGTGKTLIAKAVANETEAAFLHISGPEIMGKFYGESEAKLRSIFEEGARHAPSIVFIDEIDSIAPKRSEMGGEKQVERRVVAQLLALMDGLESRGQVIVIGATNIPDSLDPALRRPGRFDREISISIPDRNARVDILHIHTRGMPLAQNVEIKKLAEITHGFVGADLEALAREAAMYSLRKIIPQIEFTTNEIPYELLLSLEVTMDDFYQALKEIEPSALREVFVEVPQVKWEDIGGLKEVKQILEETVKWPLEKAKLFEYAQILPSKGILLFGPPGTGKTLMAKAAACESGVNFISIKGPALISKWVGESEKAIRDIFKKAKQAAPCILFFDELDAIAPIRGGGGGQVVERVISQFLTELDGIEELKGVVVLGATNRIDMIDPALIRAGRFDYLLELPLPKEEDRKSIFKIHLKNKPIDSKVDLEELVKETQGMAGAEIEAICRRASISAIREFIEKGESDYKLFKITPFHFKEVLKEINKKIKK